MSINPDRVDDAYEAIRAHLHERPYADDPSRIYGDLGALTQLLAAVEHLVDDMAGAAGRATGADDGEAVAHRVDVAVWLGTAQSALSRARGAVEDAHIYAGHLIFEVASRAGE